MASRALTTPPRTFDELVRQVRDALIKGQSDADRVYLETYRQTGRLIDAHLLANQERADYGAQVIPRLAEALETNDRLLYRCLRFVREYPILTPGSELGWSHYRLLIEVPDKKQRRALELEAHKQHWNSKELERRVRMVNAIDVTPDRADTAKDVTPPKPLTPKRGTVGLHLIVARGERLAVDLGFKLYRPLDAADARRFEKNDPSTELRAGVIVRLGDGSVTPAADATKAQLFTYAAAIRRVVDGDTLVIEVEVTPGTVLEEKLRLRGLDCPEMDTPDGKAAKRFVEGLVTSAKAVTITTFKPDKYDRYLADVFLDGGESEPVFLNNVLLANGHAVRKDEYALTDWGE